MNFVPPWAVLGDGWSATDSTSTSSPGPELVRGHRRSRSDPGRTGEDDEARLAEQRYRNRLSARMHRRRASEHLARLRQDVLCKEHEHAALASRVASLEDCNRALRTRVHETWAQLSSLLACLPQPLPQCQPQEPPPQQEQQQKRLPSIAELVRSSNTALPHAIVLPALRDRSNNSNESNPDTSTDAETAVEVPVPNVLNVSDGWDAEPCSLWPNSTPEWDVPPFAAAAEASVFAPAITTYTSDSFAWI